MAFRSGALLRSLVAATVAAAALTGCGDSGGDAP